jgi:hypothetical protein
VRGGLPGVGQVAFHAAADIEQERNAHTRRMGTKIGDGARAAGIEHLEVARGEIANESSFVISHDCRDTHNVDAGPEGGYRLLLRQQFGCHRKHQHEKSRDSRHVFLESKSVAISITY